MEFNTLTNLKTCYDMVQEYVPVALVYYSHIPTAIASLIVGFFVLLNNRKIEGWIVFLISAFFSAWSFVDIVLWTSYNSVSYMFFWSISVIFEVAMFICNLYLIMVVSRGKDVRPSIKYIWFIILLPIFALVPTVLNISHFDYISCMPVINILYDYYVLPVFGLLLIWFLVSTLTGLSGKDKRDRGQIIYLSLGSFLFLFSFFASNLLVDYLINNEIMSIIDSYKIEMFSLFLMPVYLGLLAYVIVKYNAFNVKLIGAQAIMVALVVLIASQFAFIQNPTNRILTGITLLLASVFGWQLIRSVKREIQQKEQLQIANEKLVKLDQAKSEFISIASHQLRTPLTVIKGYISMILEGNFGKITVPTKESLSKVYESNERLINLVESLLNVSRIESGRLQINLEQKQLEDLVASVCDELTSYAARKNLKFEFKKPVGKLPPVMMDEEKFRQVIMNLVDNSIKYTMKGSVTVTLKKQGDKLLFCVSDSGLGIKPGDMPNLFKKFSRGTGTSLIHTEGTGLGLYVVRQIAEAHGGRAWAESAGEGLGSKFFVEMPVAKS